MHSRRSLDYKLCSKHFLGQACLSVDIYSINIEREQRRMKSIERIRSSTESCRCQLSDTTITLPGIMGVMQEQTAINSGLKPPWTLCPTSGDHPPRKSNRGCKHNGQHASNVSRNALLERRRVMAFGALSYIPLVCRVLVVFFFALAEAANEDKKVQKASYAPGDAIPVSCLNRTM